MKDGISFLPLQRVILIFIVAAVFVACRKQDGVPYFSPIPPADTTTQSTDTTTSPTGTTPPPADTLPAQPGFTYLALGDSYTIGESVDSSLRFPAQTAALLTAKQVPVSQVQYIAGTGWATTDLADVISMKQPQGPYDIVSLLIGVNDQYQTSDTTGYRSRFTALLVTAISLAGNRPDHVFVLSIPDYGVTPFGSGVPGIGEQINQFNTINKDVAVTYHTSYTDVTTISRNDAGDATMLASDGLHPSGKQYAQWAQALEPAIYAVLK